MNNIIRNVEYIVLFSDRRQFQACKQLARTYFSGEEEKLVEPFKRMIEEKERYTYMLIDFENAAVRFNCLRPGDQAFTVVKGVKKSIKSETFREMLIRKLSHSTTEDGNFIYPGSEDADDRTGSNLHHLVAYAVHDMQEKPLDYDIFREFLITKLKIPASLLYKASK